MATPQIQDIVNSMPLPSAEQINRVASLLHASANERRPRRPIDLQKYIDKAVAEAPMPSEAQVKELGRLLAPAMLRRAHAQLDAEKTKGEWDV